MKPKRNPNAGRHFARPGEAELIAANIDLAHAIAFDFFLPGADFADVQQEALIGLMVAAREYDGSSAPFRGYASMVIHRWLKTCVTLARREKHRPLSEAARMTEDDEGEIVPVVDLLPGGPDPVDVLIARQEMQAILDVFKTFSPLERRAMLKVLNGEEYAHDKRLDNATQRARRKLRHAA